MPLRLGGLGDLDPFAVPLPAGTEVTTRVDRLVDGVLRPSTLPRHPEVGAADRVLRTACEEAARRWVDEARFDD